MKANNARATRCHRCSARTAHVCHSLLSAIDLHTARAARRTAPCRRAALSCRSLTRVTLPTDARIAFKDDLRRAHSDGMPLPAAMPSSAILRPRACHTTAAACPTTSMPAALFTLASAPSMPAICSTFERFARHSTTTSHLHHKRHLRLFYL